MVGEPTLVVVKRGIAAIQAKSKLPNGCKDGCNNPKASSKYVDLATGKRGKREKARAIILGKLIHERTYSQIVLF